MGLVAVTAIERDVLGYGHDVYGDLCRGFEANGGYRILFIAGRRALLDRLVVVPRSARAAG